MAIFFHTRRAFDTPVRESPSECCHTVWYRKTMVKNLMICLAVLTEYRLMTDGRTDRHYLCLSRCLAPAERGKNCRIKVQHEIKMLSCVNSSITGRFFSSLQFWRHPAILLPAYLPCWLIKKCQTVVVIIRFMHAGNAACAAVEYKHIVARHCIQGSAIISDRVELFFDLFPLSTLWIFYTNVCLQQPLHLSFFRSIWWPLFSDVH